jgi:hypothetical protein
VPVGRESVIKNGTAGVCRGALRDPKASGRRSGECCGRKNQNRSACAVCRWCRHRSTPTAARQMALKYTHLPDATLRIAMVMMQTLLLAHSRLPRPVTCSAAAAESAALPPAARPAYDIRPSQIREDLQRAAWLRAEAYYEVGTPPPLLLVPPLLPPAATGLSQQGLGSPSVLLCPPPMPSRRTAAWAASRPPSSSNLPSRSSTRCCGAPAGQSASRLWPPAGPAAPPQQQQLWAQADA